jgi:hypothetical protein
VILNPEREASPNSNSSSVEHALLAEEPAHSEGALIDLFGEPQFDPQESYIDVICDLSAGYGRWPSARGPKARSPDAAPVAHDLGN